MKKIFIIVLVVFLIVGVSIFLRIHYVNQTRGRCVQQTGGCDIETMLCVDSTTGCDFMESIHYYFFSNK